MLKAAVVGLGSMGRNHARVYQEMEGVELIAAVDTSDAATAATHRLYGTPAFRTCAEMLAEVKPDLVSLAVPTVKHFEAGLELLDAGVNVLIEKPIASTLEQAEELCARAEQRSVVLAVGHIERFNPVVTELRRRLGEGMVGRIYQVYASRLSPYPTRITDAGVLMDLASHDIDLMLHLVQQPVERVYGEMVQSINSTREDMFNGLIRFRNGVQGVLNVNWMTPRKVRELTLTGARGMFHCNLLSQELFFYENETAPSQWDQLSVLRGVAEGNILGIRIQRKEPLRAELEDFAAAVNDGRSSLVSGREGMETLRTTLQFQESATRLQVVRPAGRAAP